MTDHRKDMKIYIEAAEEQIDNPIVSSALDDFWKAYDKMAAAVKLVDHGALAGAHKKVETQKILKRWAEAMTVTTPYPYQKISSNYDNPNWEDDEFKGK